jgi:hypothetical protein
MSARAMFKTVLFSVSMVGILSPAYALTEQELTAKLESAGYSQIRDVKSTPEGTLVKAMKNGNEVSLVVDSSGQYREQQEVEKPSAGNPPHLAPVQPERSPRQAEQSREQDRRSAEDIQLGRDWRAEQRDGDRRGQRRIGRMNDEDDSDHRTVGRNWRMQRGDDARSYYDGRGYYDEDRPRTRIKICTEYENGDEVCRYRN